MFRRLLPLIGAAVLSLAGPAAADLRAETFPSPALARDINANVYVPAGDPPPNGWPVLYLLHGHDGNQNSWRDLGDILPTLDRLIDEARIQPLVVVMPDAGNSWYVDSAALGGPGNYETALTRDLRLAVEGRYPVRRDREGRAIAGLSMGGYGALRLAYAHNDLYVAAASLSGAIWQNIAAPNLDKSPEELMVVQQSLSFSNPKSWAVTSGIVLPSVGDHFSGAFGRPFEARRFNEANVFTLVDRAVAADKPLPVSYITSGDDDPYRLWRGAVVLHETLQLARRSSELRITDGQHVWALWQKTIVDTLLFIDKQWLPTAYPQPAVAPPKP